MIPALTRKLIESSRVNYLVNAAFFRFAVVGLITTVLDFILFGILAGPMEIAVGAANIMSYSCGIAVSFGLNRMWTFGKLRGQSPLGREAMKFMATHAAGLTISTLLVSLLALVFPALVAKTISVPVVFVWNYVLARYWVFK